MAPEPGLKTGDVVEVVNMPETSGMNGIVGTLVKAVGANRWALKVEGDERSKVVSVDNLQKQAMQPKRAQAQAAPKKYSIVGTWDDWEPADMAWNAEMGCFEYRVIMGDSGSESFKVLQDADWDKCVYPSRKDASPHVDHDIFGPDDGGLDEEWTIGLDPKDDPAEGTAYRVRMVVERDGKPKRVTWELLKKEAPKVEAPAPAPVPAARPAEEGAARRFAPLAASPLADDRRDDGGRGGLAVPQAGESREAVLRREREAGERLARRFEEEEKLPIADGGNEEEVSSRALLLYSAETEQERHQHQIEVNRERYRGYVEEQRGPDRTGLLMPGMADREEDLDFSAEETEELLRQGWDPRAVCDGFPAWRRVRDLVDDGSLSKQMAVKYVMNKYARQFIKPTQATAA